MFISINIICISLVSLRETFESKGGASCSLSQSAPQLGPKGWQALDHLGTGWEIMFVCHFTGDSPTLPSLMNSNLQVQKTYFLATMSIRLTQVSLTFCMVPANGLPKPRPLSLISPHQYLYSKNFGHLFIRAITEIFLWYWIHIISS